MQLAYLQVFTKYNCSKLRRVTAHKSHGDAYRAKLISHAVIITFYSITFYSF
jgi:hypothetical protein